MARITSCADAPRTSRAKGDYGPDDHRGRFATAASSPANVISVGDLFDRWVAEKEPADGTVSSWQYAFRALAKYLGERGAETLSPNEAQEWIDCSITATGAAPDVVLAELVGHPTLTASDIFFT